MKHRTSNKLTYNILQLQNLIKRDPQSYYEEFYTHYQHFQSLLRLFMMKPQEYNDNLADLVMFLAHVSSYYKEDLENYPTELMDIVRQNYSTLDAGMRMCFCKALILMRNRGIVDAVELITLFFTLLRSKSKVLRKHLQTHIISDVKNMNIKHKNPKVNSALQNFMFKMLADQNSTASKVSLDIMIELYKKNVWKDAKSVNAIATACFSKVNKILVAAHQFFLGADEVDEEKDSSESEDDTPNVKEVMSANKVNKKSRRRMKLLKRTKQVLNKSKKKKNKEVFDFSAIHLLHDPQGMSERLLKLLSEMNERYEIKMMVMNLISRLVGVHQLILLNFYPLLIRYIKPHQRDVTKILMFAAQASHEYVPPDALEPVVKTIANHFITERNSHEVMTVGINSIREICMRCPLAISHELLHDIAQYKKYKNKNVMMAARGVIQLFRKINPQMLKRRFRNRPTEAMKELNSVEYGALNAKSYIPGTEVLSLEPSNEDNSENPIDDDANDSDGSWIDVSHSEDELPSDDEEDEEIEGDTTKETCEDEEIEGDITKETCEEIERDTIKETCGDEEIEDDDDEEDEDDEEADDSEEEEDGSKKAKRIKIEESVVKESSNSDEAQAKSGEKDIKKENPESNSTSNLDDKEKAMLISQSRLLSQEEFRKLKAAQLSKQIKFAKGKKRKAENSNLEDVDTKGKEIVSLRDIEKLHKKPKDDKQTRLATVMEGREGREKFGKKKKTKSPFSSKTQKEQKRCKNFMMIKHKVRSKQKKSFKDKQLSLKNALLKRRRNR